MDEETTQTLKGHPSTIVPPAVAATDRITAASAVRRTEGERRPSGDPVDVADGEATYASPSWRS